MVVTEFLRSAREDKLQCTKAFQSVLVSYFLPPHWPSKATWPSQIRGHRWEVRWGVGRVETDPTSWGKEIICSGFCNLQYPIDLAPFIEGTVLSLPSFNLILPQSQHAYTYDYTIFLKYFKFAVMSSFHSLYWWFHSPLLIILTSILSVLLVFSEDQLLTIMHESTDCFLLYFFFSFTFLGFSFLSFFPNIFSN